MCCADFQRAVNLRLILRAGPAEGPHVFTLYSGGYAVTTPLPPLKRCPWCSRRL